MIWIVFLTFPIMIIKVNTIENVVEWRWSRLIGIAIGSFVLSFFWRLGLRRREAGRRAQQHDAPGGVVSADEAKVRGSGAISRIREKLTIDRKVFANRKVRLSALAVIGALIVVFPFITSLYQTNIMITALMYVILGLGLNIVVGLGGILNLGYAAFYMVGAYSYALLNQHFGLNFWIALPLGAALSTIFGVLLALPLLRLRGDYLAIVTLAFAEIARIVMQNWGEFSMGPVGIAGIPRPGFFGINFTLQQATDYIYFLAIILTILTIFTVNRLQNSRLGRAWVAMREDEIACEAMGIDVRKAKLTSFALGATWAGIAGVLFAAKTTYINPASFTVWESIIILCIVVLGGMGSILGVILAALVLILLPEYLRAFSEYRMIIFGVALVLMMVFRQGGIITAKRKMYTFKKNGVARAGVPATDRIGS
ncbi:MAG: branched-chain amino acid ABC transporter permease [Spirochaetales bacterium]|nr:branched-chain amino acid ABC transporter permease [Spirochaetales bacterium]